jgi:hypothetical protein
MLKQQQQPQIQTKIKSEISKPILIPTKNSSLSSNQKQYSLKQNCFNPNKASPPSSWNFRLMQRISEQSNSTLLATSP